MLSSADCARVIAQLDGHHPLIALDGQTDKLLAIIIDLASEVQENFETIFYLIHDASENSPWTKYLNYLLGTHLSLIPKIKVAP